MENMKWGARLSGNALKVLAATLMVIDHTGLIIFPDLIILRIIGRISFPIFAYMICEGCRHTKNRKRHLLQMLLIGLGMSLFYAIAMNEIFLNVLVTFSCSVILIYLLSEADGAKSHAELCLALLLLAVSASIMLIVSYQVEFDYGFCGIILPVLPFGCRLLCKERSNSFLELIAFAFGLLMLSVDYGGIQFYCFLSLIPLGMYNGKRGFALPKYAFYVFYPLHIAIIYLIGMIV